MHIHVNPCFTRPGRGEASPHRVPAPGERAAGPARGSKGVPDKPGEGRGGAARPRHRPCPRRGSACPVGLGLSGGECRACGGVVVLPLMHHLACGWGVVRGDEIFHFLLRQKKKEEKLRNS